jgi:hypothetical protein
MLSNAPDFRHRAQLIEKMDESCSRDDLRAGLRDISRAVGTAARARTRI